MLQATLKQWLTPLSKGTAADAKVVSVSEVSVGDVKGETSLFQDALLWGARCLKRKSLNHSSQSQKLLFGQESCSIRIKNDWGRDGEWMRS